MVIEGIMRYQVLNELVRGGEKSECYSCILYALVPTLIRTMFEEQPNNQTEAMGRCQVHFTLSSRINNTCEKKTDSRLST